MAKSASSGGRSERPRSPLPPPTGGQKVGARRFLREAWVELRKVQWPSKQEVAQGTLVVSVVTIVFAAYLAGVDQVAARIVKELNKLLS